MKSKNSRQQKEEERRQGWVGWGGGNNDERVWVTGRGGGEPTVWDEGRKKSQAATGGRGERGCSSCLQVFASDWLLMPYRSPAKPNAF